MKHIILSVTSFVKQNIFPISIILIAVLVCYLNYEPNTFLTGWDTLHNEFNFKLSFIRNIFGVWREYQGLGAVAAHAESADLPRQIFIFIESFVLPLNFLRYSYVFLTLILGPLGVYFLLDRVTLKSVDPTNRHIAAFIAALYYLLNLATVQLFYVPFEMFQTQFAFLPWLMLFSIKYFETGSVKQLALFAVFTVFALPQAYAPVLFYAYFAGITVFFFIETLVNRKNNLHTYIKRGLLIVVTTLAINAYWLLPNIYYVINHSHDVTNAIVNKVFSDEAFSYNEKFGSVKNVALLKNFLFDWKVYEDNGVFGDLLHAWNNHLSNTLTLVLGYGMFALVIVGGFFSFKDRSRFGYGFGALLLLA
ncbi:hypothetical protein KC614_04290, partial [candidate division WWE3 bacterium]|nr:hypothetical protein [candidate division WWE3 bacterium]